jgi:DDE superfamily endonuclease
VVLLDLILEGLVGEGAPVRLVCDDTLFRRSGRKVYAAGWHHDPLGAGRHPVAWGNNWVVVGVLVDLPFLPHRPVCLPILARLWWPGHTPGRLELAVDAVTVICGRLGPHRRVDLVVDGAYAGKALQRLPRQVTITTRLRADAALYALSGPRRPGQRGRTPTKGARLPDLHHLAGLTSIPFALHTASLYRTRRTLAVAHFACLWPSVFATRPVTVTLLRDPAAPDSFDLALVSTDLSATAVQLACRWPIEVCFRDARQEVGVGQARNRTRLAVERTVPFGLVCFSLAVVWYATCGHHPADLAARRALTPWYQTKTAPSVQDMLAKLRRMLIAAQYQQGQPRTLTLPDSSRCRQPGPPPKAELRNSSYRRSAGERRA